MPRSMSDRPVLYHGLAVVKQVAEVVGVVGETKTGRQVAEVVAETKTNEVVAETKTHLTSTPLRFRACSCRCLSAL